MKLEKTFEFIYLCLHRINRRHDLSLDITDLQVLAILKRRPTATATFLHSRAKGIKLDSVYWHTQRLQAWGLINKEGTRYSITALGRAIFSDVRTYMAGKR